jgi:16S rRNA (cytosine1402-N4)-methyltransferase
MEIKHIPVLLKEAIDLLSLKPNDNVIDCTVGGGGHAEAILERISPDGKLIGLDLNSDSIEYTRKRLAEFQNRIYLIQDNFKNLTKIKNERFPDLPINAFLFDLGLSSLLLNNSQTGFSFEGEAPLDMRFSGEGETAGDILNNYPFEKLNWILREYGQEKFHSAIASQIINWRQKQKFINTKQLVLTVLQVYKDKLKSKKEVPYTGYLHPATKTFQALRIAVNDELNNLKKALPQAIEVLEKGGRVAVISFHSFEDRIVKQFFRTESKNCLCGPEVPECRCHHKASLKIINKKPIKPGCEEVEKNPSSRSALLRVAEKI